MGWTGPGEVHTLDDLARLNTEPTTAATTDATETDTETDTYWRTA